MKYALILLSTLLLMACSDKENENLKSNNDRLISSVQQKNKQISNLIGSLNKISDHIDEVKEKEQLIITTNTESPVSLQRKILNDVALLDELLETSKWEITDLEKQLKQELDNSDDLVKVMSSLKMEIAEREKDIRTLKEDILNWEICSAELNDILNAHVIENELMKRELNKVYFTFGTMKELKAKGVVEKSGGVFGVFGGRSLKDNFNKTYFTEADLREISAIPLSAKKLEIITPHHEDSYMINLNDENIITELVILDRDKFWSASKYLTMVVKS